MLKIGGRSELLWSSLLLAPKESYSVACVYKLIGNLEVKIQVSVQNVVSLLVKYLS